MQPTASSLAKRQYVMRPEGFSRLPALGENAPRAVSPTTLQQMTHSGVSPTPSKIFSKPLTADAFSSPTRPLQPSGAQNQNMTSLSSAANAMMGGKASAAAHTGKKSKVPVATHKPRVSRSRVLAKLGEKRAQDKDADSGNQANRTRSSLGALKSPRSAAAVELGMSAKKLKVRQSELYAARRVGRPLSGLPQAVKAERKTMEGQVRVGA